MKRLVSMFAVACLAATASPVSADLALAQASGCVACHQVEVKLVGPSYKEVAAKYQGDPEAKALLISRVRTGAVGIWGQIPMPPNITVSDADLDTLIAWVLAQ